MYNSAGKALYGSQSLFFYVLISSGILLVTGCSTSSHDYTPQILLSRKRVANSSVYVRPVLKRASRKSTAKDEITADAPKEKVGGNLADRMVASLSEPDIPESQVPNADDKAEETGSMEGEPFAGRALTVSAYEDALPAEDDAEFGAVFSLPDEPELELEVAVHVPLEPPDASGEDIKNGSGKEEEAAVSPDDNAPSAEKVKEEISKGPAAEVAESVPEVSNQELIDSALYYWQASNDLWEQGELDKAITSLDQAYGLILKVDDTAEPELLQQKEDLRITISRQVIEVYSSRYTVANGKYKAIPLEMNEHVKKALDLFKGKNRKFFLESYVRSGRYRPAIVRALKEAGLPEELSWLPLIESGFKLRALSSARALGMWQFIASTGYKFGLKRDAWIDERMNPEKSTMAAVAYLTELHQIFGDWTTALAAYNCGENRVLRNIKEQKVAYLDNFWDLYRKLPPETAFYVPKFLAVLHIINDPEAHGFVLPPVEEELETREVSINRQVSLKKIAKNIGVSYRELKTMNQELRQSVTPKGPYSVNVPADKAELLLARIDEIPVYVPPVPKYFLHRVRRGESLSGIATRYRTSVRSIMRANGLRRRSYIKAGWKLKIPSSRFASVRTIPSSGSRHKVKKTEYMVKRGDSLWKIARQHRVTVNSIKRLNGLRGARLRIGQVLKIFADQYPAVPVSAPVSGLKTAYHVKKGDSPYNIARRHNMGLSDFLTLNNLTPRSTIYPGQTLVVQNKSL